ncbi:MAG TPA: universal stress protein [Bacteroidales bacterium]|nr:universal stress protein [Bacteroidales bacterium]
MENYRNILVPFDFNEQSEIALGQSYNLARMLNLEITLLYVYEEGGMLKKFFSADQSEDLIAKMESELLAFAEEKAKETGLKINHMVARGKVYEKITEVAEMIQALFIIMGKESNVNTLEPSVGANTSRVIRISKCPVITISSETHFDGCRSILLPIDLTQESRQKVTWAIELAKMFGSTIKVVTVLWSVNHKEIKTQLLAKMMQVKNFIEERNVKCSAEMIEANKESDMVPSMLVYAKQQGDIDLILIMTQQETGLVPFFVNSHATEVIRRADFPVMSVVPKDMGETLSFG